MIVTKVLRLGEEDIAEESEGDGDDGGLRLTAVALPSVSAQTH